MRKSFLAQPLTFAEATEIFAEASAYIHTQLTTRMSAIDLQTMRDIVVDLILSTCP